MNINTMGTTCVESHSIPVSNIPIYRGIHQVYVTFLHFLTFPLFRRKEQHLRLATTWFSLHTPQSMSWLNWTSSLWVCPRKFLLGSFSLYALQSITCISNVICGSGTQCDWSERISLLICLEYWLIF